MFTGIITNLGRINSITREGDAAHLCIQTDDDTSSIALGASIACNGVCLTVAELGDDWFSVTASAETLATTTLGGWKQGDTLNLERALKMGDELGGHLVTGHVDSAATIVSVKPHDVSYRIKLRAPDALKRYIARKGSVALDGISLTINAVDGADFDVNIIPHTWEHTTLHDRKVGDALNLEVDLFARYIERQLGNAA